MSNQQFVIVLRSLPGLYLGKDDSGASWGM
jgi:hypothetical protein